MKRGIISLTIVLVVSGLTAAWIARERRRERASLDLITSIKANDSRGAVAAIKAGADPNAHDTTQDVPSSPNDRLREMVSQILHGQPETARVTRDNALIIYLNKGDYPGEEPVDEPDLVNALIDAGANVNTMNEQDGVTPLILAIRTRRIESVKALIKHGANLNMKDKDGTAPISWAASQSPESLILLLNAGVDVNTRDKDGGTPLHTACSNGYLEAVEVLLKHHAAVNALDSTGDTPLDAAIEEGKNEADGTHHSDWKGEKRAEVIRTMRAHGGKTSADLKR